MTLKSTHIGEERKFGTVNLDINRGASFRRTLTQQCGEHKANYSFAFY